MSAAMPPSMPPQSLTAGMPDPSTIAKQKDAYMKMLDEQVKQGTQVLEAQVKHQKVLVTTIRTCGCREGTRSTRRIKIAKLSWNDTVLR